MSDEDVMIEFMHLMRGGDEKAAKVFEQFGSSKGNNGQRIFVKQVRKFLAERKDPCEGGSAAITEHCKENNEISKQVEPGQEIMEVTDKKDNSGLSNDKSSTQIAEIAETENTNSKILSKETPSIAQDSTSRERNNGEEGDFQSIIAKLSIKQNTVRNNGSDNYAKIPGMEPSSGGTKIPKVIRSVPISPPPGLGPLPPSPSSKPTIHDGNEDISSSTMTNTPSKPMDTAAEKVDDKEDAKPAAITTKWQPKRFLTRIQEQPGKLLVNNQQATLSGHPHIVLPTKKEFLATWSLPLQYLQQRTLHKLQLQKQKALNSNEEGNKGVAAPMKSPENLTIRDALQSLTVGLFRRGCSENGSNHSIISKQVVPSKNANHDSHSGSSENEYHFEINDQTGIIYGTVPFYSPRTPGNVVLRLYFEDDAPITLATSRCIRVIVNHEDLEQTLRFILSNFKTRKGSTGGSLSCIHSLSSVLDQLQPIINKSNYNQHQRHRNSAMDGSGRAAWGGICESRKIVDSCRLDYFKKKDKLEEQLDALERLKEEELGASDIDEKDEPCQTSSSNDSDSEAGQKLKEWREKKSSLMGERSSNERKWREVQGAFANVLKAVVSNSAATTLLKHDIVMKLRLEYELWCPLCETFAPNPFHVVSRNETGETHSEKTVSINYPHPITSAHINRCKQSCAKMQKEVLGFIPKTDSFASIECGQQQQPIYTSLFSNLSKAMEKMYNEEYVPSMESIQKKAQARDLTQNAVSMCDAFPQGTRVVIFGSSANGFGSPLSDLDMCLQLPPSVSMKEFEGEDGSSAMAALADKLEELGMVKVDKARLTARIPVIKFYCPVNSKKGSEGDSEDISTMTECDISMQNPLAVINTALLRHYSALRPEVRILVAIIKRWAKSRDINNPSNHTLSSYGYIIMLLHFLTTHQANGTDMEPFYKLEQGSKQVHGCPYIPNLQWMNPHWVQSQLGTTYQEIDAQPKNQYTMMAHPSENTFLVNKYFCQVNDEVLMMNLRQHLDYHDHHRGQRTQSKPLVGRILASFFYYYAYKFDYKKHVVSLQSHRNGSIEREGKSEHDGWKSYGQSLCIEDPFETFYDVAHVLKPMSFQRMKREFVLAYTKIVESFAKSGCNGVENSWGHSLLDTICEEAVCGNDQ